MGRKGGMSDTNNRVQKGGVSGGGGRHRDDRKQMRQRMGARERHTGARDRGVGGERVRDTKHSMDGVGSDLLSSIAAVGGVFLMFVGIILLVWWAAQPEGGGVESGVGATTESTLPAEPVGPQQ